MQVVFLALAAVLAVCHAQFFSPGLYQQKQALARRLGIIHKDENRGLKLSCRRVAGNDASAMITDVTIKKNKHLSGHSGHHSGHHHHLGGRFGGYGFASPFAGPSGALALGGPAAFAAQGAFGVSPVFGHGHGHGHGSEDKLQLQLTLMRRTGATGTVKYKLIVTERAGPADASSMCSASNFGSGLRVDDDHSHGHQSHGHHHPFGAFAGPAAFFRGHGHHDDDHHHAGVIAEVELTGTNQRTINLEKLKGFSNLKQLAGRGLIVCPKDSVDEDFEGRAECSAAAADIPVCCAFVYEKDSKVSG